MLTLIIADAELETVPPEIAGDSSIRKISRERGKKAEELLLDSNYMHTAIDRAFPGQSRRRGRPDILHILLHVAMESILNKKGGLRVFIHTRNDLVISLSPEVRLPKSYNRFVGVMEKLFKTGEIKDGEKVLLKIERMSLKMCVESKSNGTLVLFSPDGEKETIGEAKGDGGDRTVIIGGFSEGDYISDAYSLGKAYSIFDGELTIWSVASEVLCQFERNNGVV